MKLEKLTSKKVSTDSRDYFGAFITVLMEQPSERIRTDGEDILCSTSDGAETIADLLEALYQKDGHDVKVSTGYSDPIEDQRTGETDDHSGWYYVTI